MPNDNSSNMRLMPRFSRLAGWSGLVAVVWLFCLPRLAVEPRVESQIRRLDHYGIDAGAMYYTELEIMKPILHRLERTGSR